MEKIINRRLELSTVEVRAAIIGHLRAVDQPYPEKDGDAFLRLNEDGAIIEWTEQCEIKI